MGKRVLSVVNWFCVVCFAAFAVMQLNDPDPMYWVTFYALGALACVLFHLRRLPAAAAGSYAIICVAMALLWIILGALGQPLPGEIAGMAYEEEKEASGFILVGIWMAVLYHRAKRVSRH